MVLIIVPSVVELLWILGLALLLSSTFSEVPEMITGTYCLSSMTLYGETFFHLLTCEEQYLAVVYCVTSEKGAWIHYQKHQHRLCLAVIFCIYEYYLLLLCCGCFFPQSFCSLCSGSSRAWGRGPEQGVSRSIKA